MPSAALLDGMVAAGRLSAEDAADLAAADELFADLQQALRLVVGTSGLVPEALSAPATGFVLDCCDSPGTHGSSARVTAHRARTESLFDRLMPPPSPEIPRVPKIRITVVKTTNFRNFLDRRAVFLVAKKRRRHVRQTSFQNIMEPGDGKWADRLNRTE